MEARLVNPVAGRQHLNFGFLLSEVVPSRHGSVTEEGDVMKMRVRMLRFRGFRARSIYLSRVCWVSWREPINGEIWDGGVVNFSSSGGLITTNFLSVQSGFSLSSRVILLDSSSTGRVKSDQYQSVMITQERYFSTSKYRKFREKKKNLYFITLFITLKNKTK